MEKALWHQKEIILVGHKNIRRGKLKKNGQRIVHDVDVGLMEGGVTQSF